MPRRDATRRRPRGSVLLARLITNSLAVSVSAAAVLEGAAVGGIVVTPLLTIAAAFTLIAVRSWFLGVWVSREQLLYVTWWTRASLPLSEITGCTSRPYAGFFTAGWRSHWPESE